MNAKPIYETPPIDHLGIVARVCKEISMVETIDSQVKSSNRKVSCGKGTQAIILNAPDFVSQALYLMPSNSEYEKGEGGED